MNAQVIDAPPPRATVCVMHRVPIGAVVLVVAMIGMFIVTNWTPWFGDEAQHRAAAIDRTAPFAGTPAQDWADGEAGVVIPPIEATAALAATEAHSAADLTDAYQRARAVMIAAMLDPAVIQGLAEDPYLRHFAKDDQFALRAALADPARSSTFVVRLAPDSKLLPIPPKVRGRMWAEPAGKGKILVQTRYAVAYALDGDEEPKIDVARLDVDLTIVGKDGPAVDRGVWLSKTDGTRFSTDCDRSHPSAKADDTASSPGRVVLPDALFDPDRPIESGYSCGR
jgi:hypothetical protein